MTVRTCNRPPAGWYCTRDFGHAGPCAAVPSVWVGLPPLESIIADALRAKGYRQIPEDPECWVSPHDPDSDPTPDKLIPMVIDCLEHESWN